MFAYEFPLISTHSATVWESIKKRTDYAQKIFVKSTINLVSSLVKTLI